MKRSKLQQGEQNKQKKKVGQTLPKAVTTVDDFAKVNMRMATVLSCEKVEGTDKFLCFSPDFSDEKRQIISGIVEYYAPVDLIGKNIIACTNLKPRKMRGIFSEGMILSAFDGQNLKVLTVDGDMTPGAAVE